MKHCRWLNRTITYFYQKGNAIEPIVLGESNDQENEASFNEINKSFYEGNSFIGNQDEFSEEPLEIINLNLIDLPVTNESKVIWSDWK